MRLGLGPPIKSQQPIAASHGRTLESLLCIQRGTTERSPRKKKKKGKVTQERKKLMVVVHGRKEEGDSILLLIGSSRFCDHRLHLISCRLSSCGDGLRVFQSWIYSAYSGEVLGRFGRYAALALRNRRWSFRHCSC